MLEFNYKIISFDIFDTLLLRPYTDPQEVWRVIEEEENAIGFAKARKIADAKTYKRATDRGGETSIEEAYAMMPKKFHGMMQKEMDKERKVLRANPEMLELWNKLGKEGKRRILVSDMYLPKEFIESVLKENGFDGWDKFYLSRDYDCRKSTGKLFDIVLKDLKLEPHEVLHIGDNWYSDVEVPKSLGVNVRHYRKVKDQFFEECPFTRHIEGRLAGALAVGWNEFMFEHPDHTYWHRLGFTMGGVLGYLYVKWIVETAKSLGKDRLLFVARDGYVWKKICNELYPEMRTEYIYAPRITSIAFLGATGNSPYAIADRQRYIDEHLKDVDTNAIKNDYVDYIAQYRIDDKCAIVDGCSSGFSAQRLIETSIDRKVFCFYLFAMADFQYGAALYKGKVTSIQFQNLSEFLFGSPELPTIGIKDCKSVHIADCCKEEALKISVAEEIAEGAVCCAKCLFNEGVDISPEQWISYSDTFMNHLSEEDYDNLYYARNATDVQQKIFRSVIWKPRRKDETLIKRVGRLTLGLIQYNSQNVTSYLVSWRGVSKQIIADYTYKTKVVKVDV